MNNTVSSAMNNTMGNEMNNTVNSSINMEGAAMNMNNEAMNQGRTGVRIGKGEIGIILSLASLAFLVLTFLTESVDALSSAFAILTLVTTVATYIFGSGIKTAFGFAKKLAFWGWIAVPFPYCFLAVIWSPGLALGLFIMMPAVFVIPAYFKNRKMKMAEN